MYVLGKHPEAQDLILNELNEKIPKFGEQTLSVKNLSDLDYLERTIKEVLRLYPSVPFIGRQIYEKFTLGNIYFVFDLACKTKLIIRNDTSSIRITNRFH